MKALLIYPPGFNMIKTTVPAFVDQETGIYPPLGLLYIAAYAKKNTNFQIEVLDCRAEGLAYQEIENEIIKRKPDLIGIQIYTFSLIDAINVANIAKKINSNIHICAGGPHPSIYPSETLKNPSIDSVVIGEGEYAFSDILNAIEYKKGFADIKGILFKIDDKIVNTGRRDFLSNEELDSLPFPARDITPIRKYYSLLAKKPTITTMITSRGCPFKCVFCDRPQMGKAFRFRSADNIIEEIRVCIGMGIEEFFFYDDTFTINKNRVLEFCLKLAESGLNKKIIWDIRSRVDTIDEEMIKLMRLAGCARIHYGVESGTEKILKVLKKEINLDRVRHIFKATSKYGIQTLAYFIFGNPTETEEDIQKTILFSKQINPDYVHYSLMTPYPGTELYRQGLNKGVFNSDYWKVFAENPDSAFFPLVWEESISRERLIDLLHSAYRAFYLRPSYVFKQIFKIRSFGELKRKLSAGLKVMNIK